VVDLQENKEKGEGAVHACRSTRLLVSRHRIAGLPDKADMHTQAAVDASTGKAYVDAIGHRCPGGILGRTVKADLHAGNTLVYRPGRSIDEPESRQAELPCFLV